MDYPKSDPRVGLHNGKFTDGSADGTIKPSLDTAAHDNALTDEILNVIRAAGLEPNEAKVDQMAEAIALMIETKSKGLKKSCRAASTGNIVLSGLLTIDGVVLVAGDRVLVKAQTTAAENGIYVAAPGAWARATDADEGAEISHGALIPVEEGTQSGNSLWMVATDGTITLGVNPATFERLGSPAPAGQVTWFAMAAAPTGWLKCNGATVSRTAYAPLFSAIGTMFGAGDGATTFKLPDLRGEFVRGWDDGRGIDSGRTLGSVQADDFKSHNHSIAGTIWDTTSGTSYPSGSGSSGFMINRVTNAAGGSETRPRNVALLPCIKY